MQTNFQFHLKYTKCKTEQLESTRCEGQESCTIDSNNNFGDPCEGTYKYTQICYECKTGMNFLKSFKKQCYIATKHQSLYNNGLLVLC
jgi:hypothetical protein